MTAPKRREPKSTDVVLRFEEAQDYTRLSRERFDDLWRSGKFPKPFKLRDGGRLLVFLKAEVDAWLAERVKERDAELAQRSGAAERR
jgi:predicted DNA-binding transcriptional regulator AlpA